MSKRHNQPGEGPSQSMVKKRAVLQDDAGQGSDEDMDTLPIEEPPSTDAQLGSSPSTSQVASHVVRLEIADNPAREVITDQQQPGERLSLDEEVLECISWGDREEGRADLLPVILRRISRQADNEISIEKAMNLLSSRSLQNDLTASWESGSFGNIRCLGECHLYLPHQHLAWPDFNSDILKSTSAVSVPPADVEMDTLSIRGHQDTGVPGLSPSTSQPELAVPGYPTSEMVKDKRTPDEHAALDLPIKTSKSLLKWNLEDPEECDDFLPILVKKIAQNNGLIDVAESNIYQENHKWLSELLVTEWRAGSFRKVRRLSERPLCNLVDKFT